MRHSISRVQPIGSSSSAEEVYAVALPFADHLELTEVDAEPEGDTWFPEWDPAQWREVARDQRDGYAFVSLERAGGRPDPSR